MGSLGGSEEVRKKAMWVFPKMMGACIPSERWGHSACFFNGLIYIFGGCRGGVHFSDVLVCELSNMTWNIIKTSGPGPGPRDSHTAVLVGHRMLVFGGTNGSKKVNDLHVLDLLSMAWARPECRGSPPPARESHTCNAFGDEKLVVFGGSGEGEANYLNDLHILDLRNMEWSSPVVRGNVPAPRDSHSSVAVGNKLYVFGGDSGDRYQGDVSVFDVNTMIWSRLDSYGLSPGARAGHASVSIGTKVYVLGGVGDKRYYNDIWVLDSITSTWARLDVTSQKSQGRFSHTATVTNLGIAVFGGCGEDERPLNELLVLQIDPLTSIFLNKSENNLKTKFVAENENVTSPEVEEIEFVPKNSLHFSSDMLHPKRRRTSNSNFPARKPEPEEHSNSPTQQSSPSQSDHDQIPTKKSINGHYSSSRVHPMFRQKVYEFSNAPINQMNPKHTLPSPKIFLSSEHSNNNNQLMKLAPCRCNAADESLSRNLIGAEVRGQVDGAFDSGYIMTATVNGKVFRGVLFAPSGSDAVNHGNSGRNDSNVAYTRHYERPVKMLAPCEQTQSRRLSPENRAPLGFGKESRANSELEGVVLTLASPGSGLGGL
ncbi:hypothetical protein CASFOL_017587 [Castilleja foliolosa]|uniref:Uncharacterized protein n=1 Tax=Castilleja foliolosa TaxID=1961234 RepID=A0ABD3DB69_9LAMI